MSKVRGFSLIELMVVVGIIAILSVVAYTVFGGAQAKGRDAKRRTDVDAIMSALEVNKTTAGYQSLAAANFSSGAVPIVDTYSYKYCYIVSSTSSIPGDPTTDGSTAYTTNWTTTCPFGYSALAASGTPAANSTNPIKVCSTLEVDPWFYCRATTQ